MLTIDFLKIMRNQFAKSISNGFSSNQIQKVWNQNENRSEYFLPGYDLLLEKNAIHIRHNHPEIGQR